MTIYYYKGISLQEYCNKKDQNYRKTIRKINNLKKRYPNKANDELVRMALEDDIDYTYCKYHYEGMSLKEYCALHEKNYLTVQRKIRKIRRENPQMSDDEVIELAVSIKSSYATYYYQGETLMQYCSLNGISYGKIMKRIAKIKAENLLFSDEEIVKQALYGENVKNSKYYYEGMSLKDYCSTNGLNYNSVLKRISKIRKEKTDMPHEELVKEALQSKGVFRYFYDSMPLKDYCKIHQINYKNVIQRICTLRSRFPQMSDELLVKKAMDNNQFYGIYYYQGIPLVKYLSEHNMSYEYILKRINKMKCDFPKMGIQDIVDAVMKNYGSRTEYYYEGMSLRKYCLINSLNYDTIVKRINRIIAKDSDINVCDAVSLALNQVPWTKYYYQGETLSIYCKDNHFDCNNFTGRIRRLLSNRDISLDSAILDTIRYQQQKRYLQNVTKIFQFLKGEQDISEKILQRIIEYLNIDYSNLEHLLDKKFNLVTAISLIWYFHDNVEGAFVVSEQRIKDVFMFIRSLSSMDEKTAENLDFGYLFWGYKSGLFDTRYFILVRQRKFLYHVIYKTMREFSLSLNQEIVNDIYDEVSVRFLELLDKTDNHCVGQVIRYLTISIKGFIWDYFKVLKKDSYLVSLDSSNDEHSRRLIEKIPSTSHVENGFSRDMMELLDEMDPISKQFAIYKYQENLDYDEIAQILGIGREEVQDVEHNLLVGLRNKKTFSRQLVK